MTSKSKNNFWDYSAPTGLDDAERAADFLHWASKNYPTRPVPIAHIVRVALSLPTLPRDDSQRIEEFRSRRFTRVRKILYDRYQCALLYIAGLGYRATTGSEDVASTDYELKNKRFVSALHAVDKTRALVNPAHIKNKALKARFDALTEVHRRLMSPSVLGKLLPPGTEEPKDPKKDPEKN